MKNEKKLLLTFDYELFLGERSGTVSECMIQPTEKILEILSKHYCKAIFFIDTAFITRLKEQAQDRLKAAQNFSAITEQLRKIRDLGHDLFLHIHPHWMDAEYLPQNDEWNLQNTARYSLHGLTDDQIDAQFSHGILAIQNVLNDPAYNIAGFRAGGLFIEPFKKLLPSFRKYGIRYDFSVLPNHKGLIGQYAYDYFDCREEKPYFFNLNILEKEPDGKFVEFPISIIEISLANRAIICLKRITHRKNLSLPKGKSAKISVQTKHALWSAVSSCSIEYMDRYNLLLYLKKLKNENFMQFLSHPKSISIQNLEAFDQFLSYSQNLYALETDFRKMLPV